MQAAQRILARLGVIILNKDIMDAVFGQLGLMVALKKESAGVFVNLRADEQYARNFRFRYLQAFPRTAALTR